MSIIGKIKTKSWYPREEGVEVRNGLIERDMRDLLMGRQIVKVDDDHMLLDDGTVLKVAPNAGCGGCASGWYWIDQLNRVDNIITDVELEEDVEDVRPGSVAQPNRTYRIAVFAGHEKINAVTVEGNDGNGYYGTGFDILVRKPKGAAT